MQLWHYWYSGSSVTGMLAALGETAASSLLPKTPTTHCSAKPCSRWLLKGQGFSSLSCHWHSKSSLSPHTSQQKKEHEDARLPQARLAGCTSSMSGCCLPPDQCKQPIIRGSGKSEPILMTKCSHVGRFVWILTTMMWLWGGCVCAWLQMCCKMLRP